jgi:hypothetical protein
MFIIAYAVRGYVSADKIAYRESCAAQIFRRSYDLCGRERS